MSNNCKSFNVIVKVGNNYSIAVDQSSHKKLINLMFKEIKNVSKKNNLEWKTIKSKLNKCKLYKDKEK